MSRTPSNQEETASASPESPKEGDFSSQQLHDNLESLEEHETCDDKRGPIVNNVPDNDSNSLLKAQICALPVTNDLENVCAGISSEEQIEKRDWREPEDSSTSLLQTQLPDSPHFMEVCTVDGRFITLVNTQTQTDWEMVEEGLSCSCQVQKEVSDFKMYGEMSMDSVLLYLKELEEEEADDEHDILFLGLPRLIAHRREPKQTLRISKMLTGVECNAHLAPCDFCHKLSQPFTFNENNTQFERVDCCEEAKYLREFIQMEKEKLEQKYPGMTGADIGSCLSRQELGSAKELLRRRLMNLQHRRKRKNESAGMFTLSRGTRYELLTSEERAELGFSLSSHEEGGAEPKIKGLTQKFYKSGTCFLILFTDGTGTVFYPSGNPAIVISSAGAAQFTYIILEDKDTDPCIKAIFSTKGYATCYHSNGLICLCLTSVGGLCFSETGDLRRRWNWLYFDPHVRNLPFKPLIFALWPHISVRIHSQEHVYVTFSHKENHVRFSVGSEIKMEFICPKSHERLALSLLERYILIKRTEIYSLLDQIQTCMSYPSANVRNIKPHYRFIAQKEKLSKQLEKQKSTT